MSETLSEPKTYVEDPDKAHVMVLAEVAGRNLAHNLRESADSADADSN